MKDRPTLLGLNIPQPNLRFLNLFIALFCISLSCVNAQASGLSFTQPASSTQLKNNVTVSVNVPAANNAQAQKINLKVDDQFYRSQPYSRNKTAYSYNLNTLSFKNGSHKLTVITIDNGRIVSQDDRWVTFGNKPLVLSNPDASAQLTGFYTATGVVRVNADKVNLKFDDNNQFVYSKTLNSNRRDAQPFSIRIDTKRLIDGPHSLILRAVTLAGEDLETISVPITVRNGAPVEESIDFDATVIPLPKNGVYTGVYTFDASVAGAYTWQGRLKAISKFENLVYQNESTKLAMDRQYYRWNNLLTPQGRLNPYIKATSDAGRIPVISLNTQNANDSEVQCPDGSAKKIWPCIVAGEMDLHLKKMAVQIRDSGIPKLGFSFVIEPGNEIRCYKEFVVNPEHKCKPATGLPMGNADHYKAAWRRLVSIFDNEGVMNVDYVWILQATTFDPARRQPGFDTAAEMYPGNDVIDWIGADPYNTAFSQWDSMQTLATGFINWAKIYAPHKPLMMPEIGVAEDPLGQDENKRANWFKNAASWLKQQKQLKAVIYFNRTETFDNNAVNNRNWRIDSLAGSQNWPNFVFRRNALPNTLQAFQNFVQDPYFLDSKALIQ